MTIRRLEALELSDFLGSLLGSVVDAQARSARATVAFIDEVGFETTPDGDRMRTVTIRYSKKDENDEPTEFEATVPLLSLVNIPSLAVREAKLSFSYDVVVSASGSESASPGTGIGSVAVSKLALIKGYARRTSPGADTSSKRTSSIDLDVTLEQLEVPIGVERLFDLAELGITETQVEPDDEDGDNP